MTTITMEEKELSRERYVECDRKLILSTLLSYSVLTFVTLVQLYLVFIIAVQTLRNIDNNTSICSFTLFCSSFKKIYIRIVFTYFLSHVCYEIPSKTLSRKKNTWKPTNNGGHFSKSLKKAPNIGGAATGVLLTR